MKRFVLFVLVSAFLFFLAGGCSSKEECNADTDCSAGYVCGDEKKCEKLSITLLFQGLIDGQVLTVADDRDNSDKTIQIDITVAAQATVGSVRDGMPVTLEVTRAAAGNDDDTLALRGLMTRTYAGILVNGFAKFLHIPFEEGEHQVRAYIVHSPEVATPTITVTATYEVAKTVVMRYYKGGTVPNMLEGAALDDNDDLDKGKTDFQVKMEAVTTGYPDGQAVEIHIDDYSTGWQAATVQDGVAAFAAVDVPIWNEITMRVKVGDFEDTLVFSAGSQQTCGFEMNLEDDQIFGKKDDENGTLSGLQTTLVISEVTQCSLGSSVKIYINKTPGTDDPDHTLSLGGDTLERSITLPESADAEDLHTVTVVIEDDDTSLTGSKSVTGLFVDITAPAAPTVTGTTPTTDTTPTWSWDTPADTVEFRYSFNETDWTVTTDTSLTPANALIDGEYTLYVQGRDDIGNWSESGSFTIVVDATAPAAPTVTGTTPTNDATPTWSWDTPTDTVEFRYSFTDGTGWTTTTATSFTPASALVDGPHTLYVQGSDAAGNWSGSGSFAITIDTTKPVVVIDPIVPCTRRTTGTMTFTVTGATTTTCRFDKPGGTFTQDACADSYAYSLDAGDGVYTLTVSADDGVGNIENAGMSITLDTTTPTFQWQLPPNNTSYKAGSAVPSFVFRSKNFEAGETVEIWDADANAKVAEKTTTGSLCNATEDVSIPLDLPDKCGPYTLYAKVTDGVGAVTYYTNNTTDEGARTSRTYTFDRYVPVIESFAIDNDANGDDVLLASEDLDGISGNGLQATFLLTVQDDIDIGRTVTLRNKTTGNTYTAVVAGDLTATFTAITIPEGSNNFGATLTDCGGNTSDEFSKTIIVDTAPPTVLFQGPTGATPGHPLWLTAVDGVVDGSDRLTGQQLKFKITGDWDGETPVVKHTVYDYADAEQSTYTYTAGEMTVDGTTITIVLPPLVYNKHKFEVTVEDPYGNARTAVRTYEVDAVVPHAVIAYPTDELVLNATKDEDAGASGVQFTLELDLTKLATPTLTASTIDIVAIPITALGGVEDGARSRKSWSGFAATLDGAGQTFPNDGSFLRLGDGFWRLTVKVTDDHNNVYDTATLPLDQQIDVDVDTNVACSALYLTANDKLVNGRQVVPTWLNSADGDDGIYDMYVQTDAPDTGTVTLLVNGTTTYGPVNPSGGIADFTTVVLLTGGVENTIQLSVNNGAAVAVDTYYVRADVTDPSLTPSTMNPVPYVTGSLWELGYGYDDDVDHETAAILELNDVSAGRLIFTIGGIEDIAGYPMHGTVTLTAVSPVGAIGGVTTANINSVGPDMVAEFTDLAFNDSVPGGQTDIEMKVTVTEQPSGNIYEKTIWIHVNLDRPEAVTPAVTTVPGRGSAFVQWTAIVGNTSAYAGAMQNRPYEYQVKYEQYSGTCSLDDSESVFDTGVAVIPLADFSTADPSLNDDDFVDPKAAGEAQSYRFYFKKRTNGAETVTADIHRNGDKYCFAVRASDAVYAQDGTILVTNYAPILSTNVVEQKEEEVQLMAEELIASSAGNHTINIKNMGDINDDDRTDFAVSDSGQQKAYVFISNATGAPTKLELTKPADAGTSFGFRLAAADLNGDARMDIVVSDLGGKNLHIYYGIDDSVNVERGDKVTFVDTIYDIDGIDDYNGDGCDDLAVGQAFYDDPEDATTDDRTGRVLVLYGDDKGDSDKTCIGDYASQVGVSYIGKAAGERFGYNVKKVGDIKKGSTAYGCFVGGHYDNVNAANAKVTNGKVFYGSSSPADARVTTYDFTVSGLTQVRTMFSGELNGDAHADFAVISGGAEIRFFFGSETGTDFPETWTNGVNRVTRSVIMDELVGAETGAWGVGNSGASADIDGDGRADTFISGVQSQSLYSGQSTFFTAHPSVYLPLPVASGNLQTTVLSYGLVTCNRNADTGNCVLYYH